MIVTKFIFVTLHCLSYRRPLQCGSYQIEFMIYLKMLLLLNITARSTACIVLNVTFIILSTVSKQTVHSRVTIYISF